MASLIEDENSNMDNPDPQPNTNVDARTIAKQKLLEYVDPSKQHLLDGTMTSLGIGTISDLSYLNLDVALKDIMVPVKIGRLKKDLENVGKHAGDLNDTPHIIDFESVFSKAFLTLLRGHRRLMPYERAKVIRDIGDELYLCISPVTESICVKVARELSDNFKEAFATQCSSGAKDLGMQIYNHTRYKKRLDIKRKGPLSNDLTIKFHCFTKRENFALNPERDLPSSFPPGENKETLENKKQIMLDMLKPDGVVDWNQVTQLMQDTYVLQRTSINLKKNMTEILMEWPFFGKFSVLQKHFCHLMMDLSYTDVLDRLNKLMPPLMAFLNAEANKKRKGAAAEIPNTLRILLRRYDAVEETDTSMEFSTFILCAGAIMEQDNGQLFLHLPSATSTERIEASHQLPTNGKPIVVVIGDDILTNPKCYVVVHKKCISSQPFTPLRAVLANFMIYFVLKITYPRKLAGILEFLQRTIFRIEGMPNEKGKTEREKTAKGYKCAPRDISARYLKFMRDFDNYCSLWNIKL